MKFSTKCDVLKLKGGLVDDAGRQTTIGNFVNCVATVLKQTWVKGDSIEDKWRVMKEALLAAANSTLDSATRNHPDWYRESESELKPMF